MRVVVVVWERGGGLAITTLLTRVNLNDEMIPRRVDGPKNLRNLTL